MNLDVFIQLGPELILMIGAFVALVVGVMRVSERAQWVSPVALVTVLIAFLASLGFESPDKAAAVVPGLWITPLTFYARWITLGVGAIIILVNWHQPEAKERGEYMSLILLSLLGVLLTASANDLIVLFFAIELVSVPTYVLIALSRTDSRAAESAVKYFFLGALSAAILAYGLSFLYGAAGTTALHTLVDGRAVSNWSFAGPISSHALIGFVLVFGGLAFKIAAVPLHVYVADVYEGAASPISGMLGFVPKLAGFVALAKLLSVFNWQLPDALFWMIWLVAAVTMTVGNVLALLQKNVKRLLAYSSVAHTGYMLVALLVGPTVGQGPMRDGAAAMLFYIAVYGAMNLGVFAVLAAFQREGRDVETLDDLAGLYAYAPLTALAMATLAFSLTGIPPTAGFIGKLYIFAGALSFDPAHMYHAPLLALVIIGVINAAVGAAYYLRIAAAVYLQGDKAGDRSEGTVSLTRSAGQPVRWGLALCCLSMLILFVWPSGLARQAQRATASLHDASTTSHIAAAASSQ